jgi:hypothetical protein
MPAPPVIPDLETAPPLLPVEDPAPLPELPKPVEAPPPAVIRATPPGRKWVLGAALGLAAAAVALTIGLSLSSTQEESAEPEEPEEKVQPEAVVVAASPGAAEPVPPDAEIPEETPPEPSDAERFFAATVAFENRDYERSKAELEVLLERQPDLAAARELMAKVERALAPKPTPKQIEPKRPEPARTKEAASPPPPSPAELLEAARSALAASDLETARSRLDALDPAYPGASKLREELLLLSWEKTLPLRVRVRHDHALGSCTGVLGLTSTGYAYDSPEHNWRWSFVEVARTERREPRRLRIETTKDTSYNFELLAAVSEEDWARHQALARR